jgi:hypothetical protein
MENGYVFVVACLFLRELKLVPIFLTLFNQGTFEVSLLFCHGINIDVLLEYLLFQETVAVSVATVKVDGTHECLKGITTHETVVSGRDGTSVTDEFV